MIQDRSARWGLIRALIAACLLAGVFAMHGLTGNHDAATALTHAAHPTAAMAPNTHQTTQQPLLQSVHQMPAANVPVVAARPASTLADAVPPSGAITVETAPDGHRHAMGDVCLAMLTVLALVVVGALALRSLLATHPVVRLNPVLRPIVPGPSPPWVQPTLSKLCVLRT